MLTRPLVGLGFGCLVLAVHGLSPSSMVHAGPRPNLATPAQRWVVDRVRVNGVPLETRATSVAMDRVLLTERLSTLWSAEAHRLDTKDSSSTPPASMTLRRDAERTVIGRHRGRLHEVISLRDAPSGGTSIVVSVSDLSRPAAKLPRLPFRPPYGLRAVTVIEQDAPGGATVVVLDAADTPAIASSRLREVLQVGGWIVRTDPSGQALWAGRRGERLDAVTVRSGQRTAVVVQVSADAR